MRFMVDAQLPSALARFLAANGHDAEHVADRELLEPPARFPCAAPRIPCTFPARRTRNSLLPLRREFYRKALKSNDVLARIFVRQSKFPAQSPLAGNFRARRSPVGKRASVLSARAYARRPPAGSP